MAAQSRAVQEFLVFREEPGTAVATAAIKALTGGGRSLVGLARVAHLR